MSVCMLAVEMLSATVIKWVAKETDTDINEILTLFVRELDERTRKRNN